MFTLKGLLVAALAAGIFAVGLDASSASGASPDSRYTPDNCGLAALLAPMRH